MICAAAWKIVTIGQCCDGARKSRIAFAALRKARSFKFLMNTRKISIPVIVAVIIGSKVANTYLSEFPPSIAGCGLGEGYRVIRQGTRGVTEFPDFYRRLHPGKTLDIFTQVFQARHETTGDYPHYLCEDWHMLAYRCQNYPTEQRG